MVVCTVVVDGAVVAAAGAVASAAAAVDAVVVVVVVAVLLADVAEADDDPKFEFVPEAISFCLYHIIRFIFLCCYYIKCFSFKIHY